MSQQLKVGPRDRRPIARIAASLRRRAQQTIPHFSTQQIVAECFPGTTVTGRRLPPRVHDLTVVDGAAWRTHRAPHVILYNRRMSTDEQRMAIAHAVAHIIFDGPTGSCWAADDARELRCDRFAEELLVPLSFLREHVTVWPSANTAAQEIYLDQVDLIASTFRVPQSVIDRRIYLLHR